MADALAVPMVTTRDSPRPRSYYLTIIIIV